ncbi:MAG TPA: DUF2341 domain-containing protein [Bacteroidales bacterium]|nr:DUF2341 domain-containing protein [Bacteroidales bacterium]
MKKSFRFTLGMLLPAFLICAFFPKGSNAQYMPSWCMKLVVVEPYGLNHDDFPAMFRINTQAFVAAGSMQTDGDDIRFSAGCPNVFNPYWIESGMNTDSTIIWVKIPQLLADDSLELWMYFGDSLAPGQSDFNATFPNALITTGNTTVSGIKQYGWLAVNAGHSLNILSGQPLTVIAEKVIINGTVTGTGCGYAAPATAGIGGGPGGGGISSNSGCGGGGYGGAGGLGGYDTGDTPGAGGLASGTSSGTDLDMGSAGGTSDNTAGGNGGGSFKIFSRMATITGTINMDGNSGILPGGSRGGGGGAGGGIMIKSENLSLTGTLSAKGGQGSAGTSTANDSGGGGGGGRVKLFHGASSVTTGTIDVTGGIGGPYGGVAAQPGSPGTVHNVTSTFKQNILFPAQPFGSSSTADIYFCHGDSVNVGGTWYSQAGVVYDTLVNVQGCDSVIIITLLQVVVDTTVTKSGNTLSAQAANATFQWYNCTQSINVTGATLATFTPSVSGLYACIVTQNGCSAMSSCYQVTLSGVDEYSRLENIRMFPVPAGDRITLDGFVPGDDYTLEICDPAGRTLRTVEHHNGEELVLNLTDLKPGLLLLRVTRHVTGQACTFRFIRL